MNYTNVYVPDQGLKEKFLRWDNRLNRGRFSPRWLIVSVISSIFAAILSSSNGNLSLLISIPITIGTLFTTGSIFTLVIRRLHDLNRSGKFAILLFIPVVSFFLMLYLIFAKGTDGENRFGADPLYA